MRKQFLISFTAVYLLFFANISSIYAQEMGNPYVQMSEYIFHEATIDDAIDLLSNLQLKTLENEEGCLAFDVLISEENSTVIFIYESYENEKAFNLHLKKNYYIDIVTKKLKPLTKEVKVTKVYPLNFEGGMSDEDI